MMSHTRPHQKSCKQETMAEFTQEKSNYMLLKHQVWLIYDITVRNNTVLSSEMDIDCWQFLNLAWSIEVTGDHTWQLQMTARQSSSTVMFLPEASFGLRVLLLPASVCVCLSVCPCVNHLLVRAITRDPFKLGSPSLDHRCKRFG